MLDIGGTEGDYKDIECAIQVPMKARRLVYSVTPEACLCGSASLQLFHTVRIALGVDNGIPNETLTALVKECTVRLRSSVCHGRMSASGMAAPSHERTFVLWGGTFYFAPSPGNHDSCSHI